jgi:hypothetical protein
MIGEHFGMLIMLVGIPLLAAWIFAGRRAVRHPNRFALIFCVISGVFVLLYSAPMIVSGLEPPEQRFARLMREAAGIQPESHRGFGRRRRFDDEVRAQYRRLLQQNRDYTAAVDQMDVSKVRELNAPNTFMNPQLEREGLQQLHVLYEADSAQEARVREIMGDLRHTLENNAGSAAEREAMLRGFDNSSAAQSAQRQAALSSEKAWVDSVDDLHAYANDHRDALLMIDGHFIISDATVRAEFNAKVEFQEEKRKTFLKQQEQFSKSQAESLNKMGLNQKDINGK